jgi:hypothetical protein
MSEIVPPYTVLQDELQEYGRKTGFCPYFVARYAVSILQTHSHRLHCFAVSLKLDPLRRKKD